MTTTDSTEPPVDDIDETAVEEFAGHLFSLFSGGALTYLVEIGRRTGLFAAAAGQPQTCEALAERAGLNERYVREWLAAMVTGGILEYDPSTAHYWLPREHAVCLNRGAADLAPVAALVTELGRHVTAVTEAFRSGGGVPWEAYKPEIHDLMDIIWGPLYEEALVDTILPLAPGWWRGCVRAPASPTWRAGPARSSSSSPRRSLGAPSWATTSIPTASSAAAPGRRPGD